MNIVTTPAAHHPLLSTDITPSGAAHNRRKTLPWERHSPRKSGSLGSCSVMPAHEQPWNVSAYAFEDIQLLPS